MREALGEILGYRALVLNLVLKDLKLKYRGSVLGVVWSLLNPLLTLAVYTYAFDHVLRVRMEHYASFLLVGLLPWSFFSGSLLASTGSVLQNAHLIRKVHFPHETLPIATVLFGFAQLLLALLVFVPCLLLSSALPLSASLLLLPPLLLLHAVFTTGLALLLSALTTSFRDLAHLTEVALLLLFWVTPIVYPLAMAPPRLQPWLEVSPLAAFALAYQEVLFRGRAPAPVIVAGVVLFPVAALLLGLWVFRRYSPTFAERL